jgi:hypothetical protein
MIKKNDLDGIELNITITSSDYDPTILTSHFLITNKIVPDKWIDGQQIICENNVSQVLFPDRVNIISRRNRISFIESIELEALSNVKSPTIALRYTDVLATLLDIKYLNVDVSFKGYIAYPQNSDLPHRYIFEKLIHPQIQQWTEIGGSNIQGSLSFFYSFTNRELKLSIDEAMLKTSQGEESSILLFTGHFSYKSDNSLSKSPETENCKVIIGWLNDCEIYQKIVNRLLHLS